MGHFVGVLVSALSKAALMCRNRKLTESIDKLVFVVGGGADVCAKTIFVSILSSQDALIGGTAPKGLTLLSTSNFSTPNYGYPQSYYSGGFSTFISADAHTACGLLCSSAEWSTRGAERHILFTGNGDTGQQYLLSNSSGLLIIPGRLKSLIYGRPHLATVSTVWAIFAICLGV
jgi:hypothetical protein